MCKIKSQLVFLQWLLKQKLPKILKIVPCSMCLYFDVSDKTMKERLLHRGKTSGRADDNEETISLRLKTFHTETKPVISHYDKQNKLKTINKLIFKELINLEILNCQNNQLEELHPKIFSTVKKIQKIDMSQNKIVSLRRKRK